VATLRRIVSVIFRPAEEWERIAGEQMSVDSLLRAYILPLALLAPIATVIGMKTFDRDWDPVHGYLVPPEQILAAGVVTFFAIVGSIFLLAAVFVVLAPMFRSARDYVAALKVATFGSIPVLLAGATLLVPAMALVGMVGLCHSLYLYWLGVGHVLHVADPARAEFVGISLLLVALATILAGAAASAIGLI
jgi:hypothetical protein